MKLFQCACPVYIDLSVFECVCVCGQGIHYSNIKLNNFGSVHVCVCANGKFVLKTN